MDLLLYRIAGFDLALLTPDGEQTRSLLPNCAPFALEDSTRVSRLMNDPELNEMEKLPPLKFEELQADGSIMSYEEQKTKARSLICLTSGGEKHLLEQPCQLEPKDQFEWNKIAYRVYHLPGDEILVQMSQNGQTRCGVHVSANRRRVRTSMELTESGQKINLNSALVLGVGLASATLKTLKVHASATELKGRALLFLGVSGTGKSTHSSLWRKYIPECTLLNDDEPFVRILPSGEIKVYGTPWSGKTPCYRAVSASVEAFVHLEQAPENELTRLNTLEAFQSLLMSVSLMRSSGLNREEIFRSISDLLSSNIPVYKLRCRIDEEAVHLTRSLLPD